MTSRLAQDIKPFLVMDVLAKARAMEAHGVDVIHMEIGEPDFPTPQPIIQAGIEALKQGFTHYTPALGLPELRTALSRYYSRYFGVSVTEERIAITPGSSGALQLALAATINPGDEVLLADPGYPCNQQFVRLVGGIVKAVAVDESSGYQLTSSLIKKYWGEKTQAVLLASPSNPTGTCCSREELKKIINFVEARQGILIVDEIYQSLVYELEPQTVLSITDRVIVINSFSKYFGMTGWRVGWMVMPSSLSPAVDKLAQNYFLATNTPAQYAALASFNDEIMTELERRRVEFQQRRDFLLSALKELHFDIPIQPQGAFYLYARSTYWHSNSRELVSELLQEAAVAITPGYDFGDHCADDYVRFAYTTDQAKLTLGIDRLRNYLQSNR